MSFESMRLDRTESCPKCNHAIKPFISAVEYRRDVIHKGNRFVEGMKSKVLWVMCPRPECMERWKIEESYSLPSGA